MLMTEIGVLFLSRRRVCREGGFVEKEGLSRRRVCREGGFVEKEGLSRRMFCRDGGFVENSVSRYLTKLEEGSKHRYIYIYIFSKSWATYS
jgi:hypothetical protein